VCVVNITGNLRVRVSWRVAIFGPWYLWRVPMGLQLFTVIKISMNESQLISECHRYFWLYPYLYPQPVTMGTQLIVMQNIYVTTVYTYLFGKNSVLLFCLQSLWLKENILLKQTPAERTDSFCVMHWCMSILFLWNFSITIDQATINSLKYQPY
jgi:hypothetical protein